MQGEAAASWEGGRGTGDAQVGPKHATAAERQRRSRAKRKMQMEEAERARGEARGGARGGASDAGGTVLIGGAQVGGRDSHDAPMPAGDGGGRESHIAQPAGMGAPPTASAEPTTGDQEVWAELLIFLWKCVFSRNIVCTSCLPVTVQTSSFVSLFAQWHVCL